MDGDGGIGLPDPQAYAQVSAFSADGKWLYGTGSKRPGTLIWPVTRPDEPLWLGPATQGATVKETGPNELLTAAQGHVAMWDVAAKGETRVGGDEVVFSGTVSADGSLVFLVHHPYGQPFASQRRLEAWNRSSGIAVGVGDVPSGNQRTEKIATGNRVLSVEADRCEIRPLRMRGGVDERPGRSETVSSSEGLRPELETSACSSDAAGWRLIAWTQDVIRVWQTDRLAETPLELRAHTGEHFYRAALSRSGNVVAAVVRTGGTMAMRAWRLGDRAAEVTLERAQLDGKLDVVTVFAVDDAGQSAAIVGRRGLDGPSVAWLVRLTAHSRVQLQSLEGIEWRPTFLEFDDTGTYLMAQTISPDLAFLVWDFRRSPWPILDVRRFTGRLHDIRFGPGRDELTLLYGTGFVRTLSISALGVRRALDATSGLCLTPSERARLLRESPSDAETAAERCRRGSKRPWTLARLLDSLQVPSFIERLATR